MRPITKIGLPFRAPLADRESVCGRSDRGPEDSQVCGRDESLSNLCRSHDAQGSPVADTGRRNLHLCREPRSSSRHTAHGCDIPRCSREYGVGTLRGSVVGRHGRQPTRVRGGVRASSWWPSGLLLGGHLVCTPRSTRHSVLYPSRFSCRRSYRRPSTSRDGFLCRKPSACNEQSKTDATASSGGTRHCTTRTCPYRFLPQSSIPHYTKKG